MNHIRIIPSTASAGIRHSDAVLLLDDVLAILRERRGLDFTEYREGTIARRLVNRILATRVASVAAYLDLLRASELEMDRLTANLTIKVSRFYRNAHVFDLLRERVLPELQERFAGERLRVWSAGCASGEEPYTLAMILPDDAQIYATDIDEGALAAASHGHYRSDAFAETPKSLIETHARPATAPDRIEIADVLRGRVAFSRHDLAAAGSPPPGAPFHLICCRNVLIYFARPLQRRAMQTLVDNVVPGGIVCLGEAEWPVDAAASLEAVDRKSRIFRRVPAKETSA